MSAAGNAISAKSLAKYGKRLTPQNFRDMLALTSVADIASYLRSRTRYADMFSDVKEQDIHRGILETLLHVKTYQDFASLALFDRSVGEHFFEYLQAEEEINQLLSFLRCYNAGHPEEYAKLFMIPEFFRRHSPIDSTRLSQVRNFNDLMEVLRGTAFAEILEPFRRDGNEPLDYTMISAALDRFLLRRFFEGLGRYDRGAQDELRKLFSMKAELDNIRRIYRGKLYFASSPETLRARVIPYRLFLTRDQLESMITADSPEGVIRVMQSTSYRPYFSQFEFRDIDDCASRILYIRSRRLMRQSLHPSVVMACCIMQFEAEIGDIINVIEGVRYHVPPENIQKLLVTA